MTAPEPTTYERLAAPFDETHTRVLAGQTLTYVTHEQVYSRANEVLGLDGWGFRVQNAWVAEDTVLCHVRVHVNGHIEPDGRFGSSTERDGFGSAEIKRKRNDNSILDLGNDYKSAMTDAVKVGLASYGIALYLYEKDAPAAASAAPRAARQEAVTPQAPGDLTCTDCGKQITEVKFKPKDGKPGDVWSAAQVAKWSLEKKGRQACMSCASGRGQSPKAASGDLPF
jgi:hypothetical protein